jgi:two-component system sensor histidine kinase YesM
MFRGVSKGKHRSSFQLKLLLSYLFIILTLTLSAFLIFGFQLYNQTKSNYENILNQFSDRTSVVVHEFFSNVTRNTFFYITNNTLTKIIEKPYIQGELEFYDDHFAMRKAMDQIVLMNGSIAGITLAAFNGNVYSSTAAYDSNLERLLQRMDQQAELYKGQAMVSAPYTENDSPNRLVSIIRFLSDLGGNENKEGYVKVDVKYQTIENMLGGISDSFTERIGTFVVSGQDVIYQSNDETLKYEAILNALPMLEQEGKDRNKLVEMKINGDNFLLFVRNIKSANWTMVHFIPEKDIQTVFQGKIVQYGLISILLLFIVFLLAVIFANYFFKPINRVRVAMKLVDAGRLEHIIDDESRKDELGQLVQSYNAMIRRLVKSRELELNAHNLQRRAELNMLHAQINPHFLYNTLNVIHSISELHRIEEISIIAKSLASLYRYNLKSKEVVTIESELEQIRNYINIQQLRFVDKVSVNYVVDEDLAQYRILKFLIQPIVENSYYHGLERKDGTGALTLSITKVNQSILIRVVDDGIGMNEHELRQLNDSLQNWESIHEEDERKSIGLRNVCSRIKYYYGNDYGLKVHSQFNKGTIVEIEIPIELELVECEYPDR